MLKCIIIDDEEPARLLLNDYCSKIEDIEVVGMYKTPLKALADIENKSVDILLLDINMPDISGIDFLKSLRQQPNVILTTAYREYAVEGFELEVTDYLLKPIEFHRFLKAINKIKQSYAKPITESKPNETLTGNIQLKSNKKLYKIDFEDIIFIQSHSEYVMYHTRSNGKLMVYGAMKDIEKTLPTSHFYRVHRSYIVNRSFIQYIEGNQIVLEETKLPIGESYKEDFMAWW